jgi:hypothetical protein
MPVRRLPLPATPAVARETPPVLTSSLLADLRQLAPLMELRGISHAEWAASAQVSIFTLRRYLAPRTRVGDDEALNRLLAEVRCYLVVAPDGPLSAAWTESIQETIALMRKRGTN